MNPGPSTDVFLKTSPFEHPAATDIPDVTGGDHELNVFVIFTNDAETLAALRMAWRLADKLGAHLQLLMFYEVPYALPLTRPGTSVAIIEKRIRALASRIPVEVSAHVYLCRDQGRTAQLVLNPHSIVLFGGRECRWSFVGRPLARTLTKDGHHVIFAGSR